MARTGARRREAAVPRLVLHLSASWRRSRCAEDALLTGPLEPTNEWYAIAKIAGIKLCQAYRRQYGCDFISAMPTNLYGPGDNFDLAVQPCPAGADAQGRTRPSSGGADKVEIWGTGTPRREFLHVDDLADACVFLLKRYAGDDHVNVGIGEDVTIRELAETIARVVGYRGELRLRPPASPTARRASCWTAGAWRRSAGGRRTSLEDGLKKSYDWYLANRRDAA